MNFILRKDFFFTKEELENLREWVENEYTWEKAGDPSAEPGHSYQKIRLGKSELPPKIKSLLSESTLSALRLNLQIVFQQQCKPEARIMLTKMQKGDFVAIHTDSNSPGIIINFYLTRNWDLKDGGLLYLKSLQKNIIRFAPPVFGNSAALKLDGNCPHAVTEVNNGTRYSLSIFYPAAN